MTRLKIAAITLGFMVLSAASAFSQTSNETPRSQSAAPGNSASTGTESNSDHPNLAPRRAKKARHAQPDETGSRTKASESAASGTTASGASNSAPGRSKFPGAGP